MKELLDKLKNLESELESARVRVDSTPQMLDDGPYLASYDILTYENQGTINPDYEAARDEWIETTDAVTDALVNLLNAGEYSILATWDHHADYEHREIAERAVLQLTNPKTISALIDQERLQHPQEIESLIEVGKQNGPSVLVDFIASYEPTFSLALSAAIKSCNLDSQLGHFMYKSSGIRFAIIAALILIGTQGTDALISALDKFQTWPNHLGLVIYTLGMIGDQKAIDSLTKLSSHPNPSVSAAAIDAIAHIRGRNRLASSPNNHHAG